MLGWIAVIVLWIMAGAFAVSDALCVLALVHHARKDPDFLLAWVIVFLVFAGLGTASAFGAMYLRGCLL